MAVILVAERPKIFGMPILGTKEKVLSAGQRFRAKYKDKSSTPRIGVLEVMEKGYIAVYPQRSYAMHPEYAGSRRDIKIAVSRLGYPLRRITVR